jgi:hypothetical protein
MKIKRIKLINIGGRVYFPTGGPDGDTDPEMLMHVYAAGDCDTCRWPWKDPEKEKKILACALYDERETNSTWPTFEEVEILLPDGTPFKEWEYLVP